MAYHNGELAMQQKAGVQDIAARTGGMIHGTVPAVARQFLEEQRLLFIGQSDEDGRVWASLVEGEPGFISVPDEDRIDIRLPAGGSGLFRPELREGRHIGMTAVDFATRRRIRVNGTIVSLSDSSFTVQTRQVYANCPRYIQARGLDGEMPGYRPGLAPVRSRSLKEHQQAWIAGADTCFLATSHPAEGEDISHRGGNPGFIRVVDAHTLLLPDYSGNAMFNSLGNIEVNPCAGLIFPHFTSGNALQLTGRASIEWAGEELGSLQGAERLVRFRIDEVLETAHGLRARFTPAEYSPFNPG